MTTQPIQMELKFEGSYKYVYNAEKLEGCEGTIPGNGTARAISSYLGTPCQRY
ncbi:MAG: hypothetical protein ACYTEO_17380 [Planctomycetota bacterium]|jgi:hypothetical protein